MSTKYTADHEFTVKFPLQSRTVLPDLNSGTIKLYFKDGDGDWVLGYDITEVTQIARTGFDMKLAVTGDAVFSMTSENKS